MDISPNPPRPYDSRIPADPPIAKTMFKILAFMGPAVVLYSYGAKALVEHLGL